MAEATARILGSAIGAIVLDLDVVPALGIVVAEVVTNSYDHAFPAVKKGSIVVPADRGDGDVTTMTIGDDGSGFPVSLPKETASAQGSTEAVCLFWEPQAAAGPPLPQHVPSREI